MWRPLLTASFPSPAQGLHAFRKLREYRKLHELYWENPNAKSGNMPTRAERSRIIMDQKANTIADLAAVLREQEELGQFRLESQEKEQNRVREELLALAKEAQAGGLAALEKEINEHQSIIAGMRRMKRNKEADTPSNSTIEDRVVVVKNLRLRHQKMVAANETVNSAIADVESKANQAGASKTPDSVELSVEPPLILYHPPFPSRLEKAKKQKPKTPLYSADGVIIRWANPLDAEFAESWPQAVRHEAAGLGRHTAAAVTEEPVFTTEEAIKRNTSHKYTTFRDARRDAEAQELNEQSSQVYHPVDETPAPSVRA